MNAAADTFAHGNGNERPLDVCEPIGGRHAIVVRKGDHVAARLAGRKVARRGKPASRLGTVEDRHRSVSAEMRNHLLHRFGWALVDDQDFGRQDGTLEQPVQATCELNGSVKCGDGDSNVSGFFHDNRVPAMDQARPGRESASLLGGRSTVLSRNPS